MADFCNQCARELGFPEGDLANVNGPDTPPPGKDCGYPVICEGCGFILVDEKGNCLGQKYAYDPLTRSGCTDKTH